jgi:hypothetical protein
LGIIIFPILQGKLRLIGPGGISRIIQLWFCWDSSLGFLVPETNLRFEGELQFSMDDFPAPAPKHHGLFWGHFKVPCAITSVWFLQLYRAHSSAVLCLSGEAGEMTGHSFSQHMLPRC